MTEKWFTYRNVKKFVLQSEFTRTFASNLVFGAPEEGDEKALKEFRDVMQGEIQAGQLVEISTSEVLSATKDPPAWRVHQITDWYSKNLGDINTKL